jgi:hypothetical protein
MTQSDVCMHICTFVLTENVVILIVLQTTLILKPPWWILSQHMFILSNIPYLPLAIHSESSELIIKNHALTYG